MATARRQHVEQTVPATATTPLPDRRGTPLDAIRAFGVMSGPTLLLEVLAAGAIVAAARGALRRPNRRITRIARPLISIGAAAPAIYALILRPWHQRWGATDDELQASLPGDELEPEPGVESTRAVTIDAPVADVWPWLAQIGQDRGGFYSYEFLENLAGCELKNADRIHPEWQDRAVGDTILLHPLTGLKLTLFEPGRALGIEGWGTYVLEPLGLDRTRLIARSRTSRGPGALLYVLFIEIPHFIMERKMLLGIKERAEQHQTAS